MGKHRGTKRPNPNGKKFYPAVLEHRTDSKTGVVYGTDPEPWRSKESRARGGWRFWDHNPILELKRNRLLLVQQTAEKFQAAKEKWERDHEEKKE